MSSIHFIPHVYKKAWNGFAGKPELSIEAAIRSHGISIWRDLCGSGNLSSQHALAHVIKLFGYSESYWYFWRKRFNAYGESGLENKSRRPRRVRKNTWDPGIVHRIAVLRNHPDTCCWGAEKLWCQLRREGRTPPSVATIERIIAYLKKTKQIVPIPGAKRKKNKGAAFSRPHADRYKRIDHGKLSRIQIDVDYYCISGFRFYHFTAVHTPTRYAWVKVYSAVSSRCATDFLMHVLGNIPTGIVVDAIQVDGGGEFRKSFEARCNELSLQLLVNHPHTPKQNAFVERLHRTIDEEFYQTRGIPSDIAGINEELHDWIPVYNEHRPHAGIGFLTPCEKIAETARLSRQGYG